MNKENFVHRLLQKTWKISFSQMSLVMAFGFIAPGLKADSSRLKKIAGLLGLEENPSSKDKQDIGGLIDRMVEKALATHPDIKVEEARVAASRANVDSARGRYQPNIGLSASISQDRSNNLNDEIETKSSGSSLRLQLRENLWRGGQDAGLIKISSQDQKIAELQQVESTEALAFAVRLAALNLNHSAMREAIEVASIEDASELRSLSERKFKAGQVGKIDVYTTGMRETSARAAAVQAAGRTREDRQKLLAYLSSSAQNNDFDQDISLLTSRSLPYPSQSPDLAAIAQSTTQEQTALARQSRAELSLSQSYKQRFMPSLDLVGTAARTSSESQFDGGATDKSKFRSMDYSLALQMSWALWDRIQDHQITAAAAEKTAASAHADSVRLASRSERERLQIVITDLYKLLEPYREAYRQADQLYDAQRQLYEAGVVGLLPLITAETDKLQTLSNWQESVYQLQLNLLRWQSLQRGYLIR